jgi:predicted nucleic acid-binding protein
MRVYLDNCVFNRPFDDQGQLLISLQTQAKLAIQERIRDGSLELAWSYILDYENAANPFEARRRFVATWKAYSVLDLDVSETIVAWSEDLTERGLWAKDALHLACARQAECAFFITTDRRILKERAFGPLRIVDPVAFLSEAEEVEHGH